MGGAILIALGTLFLLHKLDVIHIGRVWQWLPYLMIGIGVFKMALWSSAEQVASGFGLALFGTWFLITVNGWFGFDWSNSWPLALVAIGLSMVSRSLLEPLFRASSTGTTPEGGPDA
jgi:hypothetical protein